MLHGDAVGEGIGPVEHDGLPGLLALHHAGGPGGLDAVDLDLGVQMLDGVGHAGDKPTPADGDDDCVRILQLVQDLQADGALTGNDLRVVEGMDEGGTRLLLNLQGGGVGIVVSALHQADLCPQLLGRLDFTDGGAIGHTDERLDAVAGGSHGHALGVVSGAARQNTM